MSRKDKGHLTALAAWVGRELLPPVIRWVDVERLPLEARAFQARAKRALEIGEIDEHVHAFIAMRTEPILRWCEAEVAGQISAWVEPGGKLFKLPYGGHWDWVRANMTYLLSKGITSATDPKKVGAISGQMMMAGWVRYSAGQVMCGPVPDAAQLEVVQQLVAEAPGLPEDVVSIQFLTAGVQMSIPVQEALSQGIASIVAQQEPAPQEAGEVPLSPHQIKKADAGGGTDGPFQQGDGQEVTNTFMEQIQDGSTAPIERGIERMTQDLQPEVWWQQNLIGYLSKSYPGSSQPGAQSDLPASGTGPGQQFASAVQTVVRAAAATAQREDDLLRQQADMTDPSDTDGLHDQLDGFETHPLNKEDPQEQRRTRLADRWRERRSDKGVEKQIIQMEKNHLEPGQIKQELREDGIPSTVIDETYENREKNLFKVVEVGS